MLHFFVCKLNFSVNYPKYYDRCVERIICCIARYRIDVIISRDSVLMKKYSGDDIVTSTHISHGVLVCNFFGK